MRALSVSSRVFVLAAALLLGGVAAMSLPSTAFAGDDGFACPGIRCTGRQAPACCMMRSTVDGMIENDYYYFPNAT